MLNLRKIEKVNDNLYTMEYACDCYENWGVINYNPKTSEYQVVKKSPNDHGHLKHFSRAIKGALQENRTEYTVMWY